MTGQDAKFMPRLIILTAHSRVVNNERSAAASRVIDERHLRCLRFQRLVGLALTE